MDARTVDPLYSKQFAGINKNQEIFHEIVVTGKHMWFQESGWGGGDEVMNSHITRFVFSLSCYSGDEQLTSSTLICILYFLLGHLGHNKS